MHSYVAHGICVLQSLTRYWLVAYTGELYVHYSIVSMM